MTLSVDRLQVVSFSTTDASSPALPDTHDPLCYSPFCGPTMIQTQCPETTQGAIARP